MLDTETPSPSHSALDTYNTDALVWAFIKDQLQAAEAVRNAQPQLVRAVDLALPRIKAGGRLIYVGAGTSGRLAAMDGAELNPTFSWPADRVVTVLAGGNKAMLRAVEGAEDDGARGEAELNAANPTARDVAVFVAASGATPFTLGAMRAAKQAGALTIGIANNAQAPVIVQAEVGILLFTGTELISGSTRLKAGTAQKVALNTFSSALMVRLNKVYGNLMVDLRATNAKLRRRAVSLTMHATGCEESQALATLEACGFHVKVAIVAILGKMDVTLAQTRLDQAEGSVRQALQR
jgi:N-acetylmuramic acid 6-phosphate etherase